MHKNPNDSTVSYDICQPYHAVLVAAQRYYLPVVIAVGITGNLLSMLVLLKTSMKSKTSTIYLVPLAGADSGYLATVLLIYFSPNNNFDIFLINGCCQLIHYIATVCAFLSVWLTVGFTTERFIAVWYPLKRLYFCTRSRIKWCVAVIFIVSMVYTIPLFWLMGVEENGVEKMCHGKNEYQHQATIFLYIDIIITLLLPLPLLAGLNILVGFKLFKSERQRSVHGPLTGIELADMIREDSCSRSSSQIDRSGSQRTSIHTLVARRGISSTRAQTNITKMLFLVSTVFVILNVPSFSVRVIYLIWSDEQSIQQALECAFQSAQVLYITNFGVNFLLYTMCGQTFRNHCYLMLKRFFINLNDRLSFRRVQREFDVNFS